LYDWRTAVTFGHTLDILFRRVHTQLVAGM
jgi:hypothetical protein